MIVGIVRGREPLICLVAANQAIQDGSHPLR
jgi:hypothetical protein